MTFIAVVLAIATMSACAAGDGDARVQFEAQWQCDVQRRTFDDIADVEVARSDALASWGLSEQEYTAFRAELDQSPELRSAVKTAFDGHCPG